MGPSGKSHRLRVGVLVTSLVAATLSVAVAPATAQVGGTGQLIADPALADGAPCATVDGDQVCSLRAAIDAAGSGDAVTVLPGTHSVSGEISIGAGVTIQGADAPPDPPGAATPRASTIQGDGTGGIFVVDGTGVVVDGVVITGGDAGRKDGGGILVARNQSLTLTDSTLASNVARDGGGIAVERGASLTLQRSTLVGNTATRKGGGLRIDGTATIDNATITENVADQGGGLSSPGTSQVTHATIVQNAAGSSSSGGVDRNGGTLEISYSIIANNLKGDPDSGQENRDCSGTPDLLGLNLVSIIQGCNPVGDVIEAPPLLGPLSDNGGPTQTMAPTDASPALDAIAAAACVLAEDQRGTARPTGPGCDLGAYEEAPLAVTYALDVDVSNYAAVQDESVDGPEVEVGTIRVPTADIATELATQAEDPSTSDIADAALRSVALRSVELEELALRSVTPEAAALRSVALRSVDLEALALRSVALRSVLIDDAALRSVALRSVLLSDIALRSVGGWDALISDLVAQGFTQFEYLLGLPLQSVTIDDILQELGEEDAAPLLTGLTLEDITIDSSALRSVALRSVLLLGAALRSVPVPDAEGVLQSGGDGDHQAAWCAILGDLCGSDSGQIAAADLMDLDLLSVQLAGGSVDDVPVFDIPLSVPEATALRSVVPSDAALRSVFLTDTNLQASALRSVALRSVALRSVEALALIVDCDDPLDFCSTDESNEFTLGDADLLGGLVGTLGDLLALTELGEPDLLDGLSFGDLIMALLPSDAPSWETLDLSLPLQNISTPLQPTYDYVATVEVTGGPAELDLSLMLPQGFAAARAETDPPATFDGVAVEPVDGDLSDIRFLVSGVGNGVHELRVPARAGLETGSVDEFGEPKFVALGSVEASNGDQNVVPEPDSVAVNVVPAGAAEDGGGSIPIGFDEGLVSLAHISSDGDVDLYSLTVPAELDGGKAQIRLSNIPPDADYDLTVYGPKAAPLRNPPIREQSSLGDFGYDLDPTDVYPTDVAADVPLDVPESRGLGEFSVLDISTRRSGDEEVQIESLQPGETYYVAVTGHLQSISSLPYGLRARVSDTDPPPPCAEPRLLPGGIAAPPPVPPVPDGVNTLYVTNTQWLAAAVGDTTVIFDAINATAGVNGVVPMLVPVDAYPGITGLYDDWTSDRCNPDARNAIVTGIGAVLDDIIATPGAAVENIVLVGADGVVPQAAVPDGTEFSSERTFADEALFPDATGQLRSNEVSAALHDDLLLTDDAYATFAGVSINDGDHELFVPEYKLGRLGETGPEMVGLLQHFVDFAGQLDPAAVPGPPPALQSLVTGYDFLDDGAAEIEQKLLDVSTATRLDDSAPLWDRAAYLDALDDHDYRILSPNAHYDFESLLPAAPDDQGFFGQNDLVTTADVDPDVDPAALPGLLPTNALIFTMGCHAGLSMDDVQIGFPVADWAQTFAPDVPTDGSDPTANLYAAHTTYGYGDTEIVAYSERLLALFAELIAAHIAGAEGAPVSVGDALMRAKQDYLATTFVLTPYDEKILQSLTYYGLPMYEINAGEDQAPDAALAASSTTESLDVDSPVTFGTPNAAGVTPVDIELTKTVGVSGPANLNLVETPDGDYYEVDGNTASGQYRVPVPLVTTQIPAGSSPAGGLFITELRSESIRDFDPYYVNPLLDGSERGRIERPDGAVEVGGAGRIRVDDGSFPASLQRVASTIGDGPERLNVVAGQFEDGLDDGADVMTVFTRIAGELYPSAGPGDGPRFERVVGRVGETEAVVQFEVITDDTAERVRVLFLDGNPTGVVDWRGLDLAPAGSGDGVTTWLGAAPISGNAFETDINYIVQGANPFGVTSATNKADRFLALEDYGEVDLDITLSSAEPTDPTGGYYTDSVTATVDPASSEAPETLEISVDSGPFVPGNEVTVPCDDPTESCDGGHVVLARDAAGGREFIFFVIDSSAPTVEANPARNPDGSFTVVLEATDVGQSGVERIDWSTTGAQVGSRSEPDDTVVLTITEEGDTTVAATAFDVAGNESAELTLTVTVDSVPPSVTITTDPVSAADGDWQPAAVPVTISAVDLNGVDSVTYATTGAQVGGATVAGDTATDTITVDGETVITASATDAFGNTTPAGSEATVTVRVDTTPPTADPPTVAYADTNGNLVVGDDGDVATATFRCTDATSGIRDGDGCTITIDNGTVTDVTGPDPQGFRTATLLPGAPGARTVTVTAIDNAGNTSTTQVEFGAPYSVCLQYDPDQAKNVGSNFTIRLTICDADGTNLSARQIELEAVSIDGVLDPEPNDSGNANNQFFFRFEASNDRYIYNLDTTNLGALADGLRHTLDFTITEPDGTVSYGVAPFTLK